MTFRSSLVASLRRARNSARSREKEKPAKFANGSLLGSDSRIFVEHHGAYPLSRMRLSFSRPSFSSSLSFRPFLFFKVLPSRDTRCVLSSLHFLLCPFSDLWRFPSRHDALYFRFCLYFRFPFLHVSLRFLQQQRIHHPDRRVFVHSIFFVLLSFFFFSSRYLHFFRLAISLRAPFPVHHGVSYIPVGNCPSFLASPTFTARAARRYDCPNKAIRTIPFFSLVPLVRMSPTFLPCITVDFAALTSLASESSTALSARDLYLVRFRLLRSWRPVLRDAAATLFPLDAFLPYPPFFESITRPAARR